MHIGKELEGSKHLGKTLLFIDNNDLAYANVSFHDNIIETAKQKEVDGIYFGANLSLPDDNDIATVAALIAEGADEFCFTIEIPISNRGQWLEYYERCGGNRSLLHVIHRLDDMDAYGMAQSSFKPDDDLKLYSAWSGQVITFRFGDATTAIYPQDYGDDHRL